MCKIFKTVFLSSWKFSPKKVASFESPQKLAAATDEFCGKPSFQKTQAIDLRETGKRSP
jgi:hypothetical protein